MSKKNKIILTVLVLFAAAAGGVFLSGNGLFSAGPNNGWTNIGNGNVQPEARAILKNDHLEVDSPAPSQKITSPVTVSGKSNFFETNTRIRIKDETGNILADTSVNAAGCMDKLCPFTAEVLYEIPSSPKGIVEIFESSAKDGGGQNKISVSVIFSDFKTHSQKAEEIDLYYYNQQKDKDLDLNIGCSRDAVLPVEREISRTETPVQDAINLLLEGKLTEEEKSAGFKTEFPLQGFSLRGANLASGVLTLEFNDELNKTGGGSCRAGLLWAQIEKTAKQFAGVESVQFKPDSLFQP
ncbi:MAG: Gmad2 immunoglobulin-like domain-containing protein [Candidatus Paceibacterota bacterium]|jgi:hypothetical protein